MKGYFITVEGMDGCGKTTQANNIMEYLGRNGCNVVTTREPGGTKAGEKIRELLLDPENKGMNIATELMLYAAARAELVGSLIKPAIEQGQVVLCDRFIDSSIAYQGFGRKLGAKLVEEINIHAVQGCMPDITFFFDISPREVIERKSRSEYEDRIEAETIEFHNRVYEGYINIAYKDKKRVKIINARKSVEEVFSEVKKYLDSIIFYNMQ